ncbi:hypothetical protein SARC_01399 [Sphaeroforma arctica JP610]|uniref:Uncharacterized protein n=1 Tax=Sphaeroforma arctica JP610 TaxID=667725 RepID=A0A0L0GDU7_9EUKA|nr:hypothetical protein SARC_01399 [Sphaeroforma arctica JP610]KNC86443.1 hypothetical protein SARC_01399 [Sphaeroforma arctica JP610]|eukprot:XP_014160345.1 hypothetical protein SARC_01399 [Sphaeroforma arctica JP610]
MSNNPFGDDLPVSGLGAQQQQQQPQFGASQQQRQIEHTQAQSIPGQGFMGQGNPYQVPQNSYASPQYGSPANGMNTYQNQTQPQGQTQGYQHRPSYVHDQQLINTTHAKGDMIVGSLDHEHRGSLFMPNMGATQQPGPYAPFGNQGQQQQPNMNMGMGMQQQPPPQAGTNSMDQLMKSLAAMKTGRDSMSNAAMPVSFDPLMEVPSTQQAPAAQNNDPFASFAGQGNNQQQPSADPFGSTSHTPASAQNSGLQYNHNPASSTNRGIQFNNQPITEDFPDPFTPTPSAGNLSGTPQNRDADPFAPALAQQMKPKVGTIKEDDTKLERKRSEPMTKDEPVSKELDDVSGLTKSDMDRLVRECTFHTGYRGFTLDGVHTKRSVKGKYSVKIGWRTAIKICGDSTGIIIVSHDRQSILHHFKWKDIQMVDHVHKDTLSTPLDKRSRKNFLGVKLKDGSVYVINSQFTPELKRSFMEKANVPVNNR